MYHNVGSVLNRTYNIRCAEGVVYDEWYVMAVGYGSHCLKICHVGVGIAECLGVHHLGVGLNGSLQRLKVVDVDDGVADALCGQCVGDEVERTTVQIVGSYDMVAYLQDVLQSVGHGCGS